MFISMVLMSLSMIAQPAPPTGPIFICPGTIGTYTAEPATDSHRWVLFNANGVDVSGSFNITVFLGKWCTINPLKRSKRRFKWTYQPWAMAAILSSF